MDKRTWTNEYGEKIEVWLENEATWVLHSDVNDGKPFQYPLEQHTPDEAMKFAEALPAVKTFANLLRSVGATRGCFILSESEKDFIRNAAYELGFPRKEKSPCN